MSRSATAEIAVMRVVRRSVGDFDDFYAAGFQPLALQLYAYLGDLGLAQDLTQEAFCRALGRWKRISTDDEPVAWVRRTAWSLATKPGRAGAVTRGRRQELIEVGARRLALAEALATLPPNHRRAVVLHHLARLSVAEIAEQERIPQGTAQNRLDQGQAALAAALRKDS
ncbi:RNA polymerase sigma-70 factor (ECF subfamily) [Allocatelliglobosispora scoriae]|uniref:RNA polymerase sigma-70 factor (ECF subfamily) n=1 Tax=Allocatelliglobosispora scoriae TaxID=643052 RepID=A0A841BX48_9ACTN|nr:sigma-70 family RNA polymerase sigma factor [Allocatelliglobosispora scoriae]MBB5871719.1 RNA polymerase sigma-70 factor (ECF subfamily) [Allocatelliglobosispora scoriae]